MTKNSLGGIVLKAACFVLLLSFFQNSLFAQDSLASQNQVSQASSESISSSNSDDSLSQNWNWTSSGYEQGQQSASTFVLFLKMVFALAVVLALAYFAVRLLKRGTKLSSSDDPFLRHVSHVALSTNRSVDVVTILNHAYILGVSDNAVNLIGQIEDEELVNSMNLYADKKDNAKRPRSFDDILNIFMPGGEDKNQNIFGSSARNAAESLQRQRSRLNEEE